MNSPDIYRLKARRLFSLDKQSFYIISYLFLGFTVSEIAEQLDLSTQGVRYHLGKIYKKWRIPGNGRTKQDNLKKIYSGQWWNIYMNYIHQDLEKFATIPYDAWSFETEEEYPL